VATFVGGCMCGAVRVRAEAEPIFAGVCHCSNCQRLTGSAFSCEVAVPRESVAIEGETREFRHRGDSGQDLVNTFCPVCGVRVCVEAMVMPGVAMVPVGILDDRSFFGGATHIYCDSAQPWVAFPAGAARFGKAPPMGG
jgi:hypothetical protein